MAYDELPDRFRSGFRRHAAGVTIVAAATPTGPVGATVSSVASVSVEPPLLSFSLLRSSTTAGALVDAGRLVVHQLAADQVEVAAAFASRTAARFTAEQGWSRAADGTPLLAGATASYGGRVEQVIPAGGSWLVLLRVDDVTLGPEAAPLLHHDRRYWSVAPVVEGAERVG
ncbi:MULTISPECIES: flavin reductase family protein [Nocardioides]|uniref:NADH-FMN oxidoreductase RutF, flavin reductase (DIM6/NTAB) family n=1 Tax=Nocardioides lianchengensis TaxID=1045774 RepID=A0A1G6Z747_9ACTN|nr:flavin reductase family protein [Nocardioides lianchengensis]NYG11494.1 flavin reductase (DIM6/NTAB) family NADH-FMN oxidoreductase RutF [Nocardioides lianchengensis]SDD98351.1 NADH-FMN oxidoreductase RutF, flavin reductase (DIM6/NTAB) family [Nocardioides lianchengensis]